MTHKTTRWYWKTSVNGWFLWGVWIQCRWFIGIGRSFQKGMKWKTSDHIGEQPKMVKREEKLEG